MVQLRELKGHESIHEDFYFYYGFEEINNQQLGEDKTLQRHIISILDIQWRENLRKNACKVADYALEMFRVI